MIVGLILLALVVVAIVYGSTRPGKDELKVILSDLSTVVTDLEDFAEGKVLEVTDHLEEIALHQNHVSVKNSDIARATRIRDKLNELLA